MSVIVAHGIIVHYVPPAPHLCTFPDCLEAVEAYYRNPLQCNAVGLRCISGALMAWNVVNEA
jgi:hypothetical protein